MLLQRSEDAVANYVGQYSPVSDPYDSNMAINCTEGIDYIVGDVVPHYADAFSPTSAGEMVGLAKMGLGAFSIEGSITPGGALDPGFDGAGAGFGGPGSPYDRTGGAAGGMAGGMGAQGPTVYASPLVLDLDGGGITTTAVSRTGAYFDLYSDGFAEAVGRASADDGILVRDLNADGVINDGAELFIAHMLPKALLAA